MIHVMEFIVTMVTVPMDTVSVILIGQETSVITQLIHVIISIVNMALVVKVSVSVVLDGLDHTASIK